MSDWRSKEDEVQKISISIFVTNFPASFNAKDIWRVCNQYGNVVDTFIPDKKSNSDKRFGFVRFIKIANVEWLVNNLCTIWLGMFRLHVNIARFQRKPLIQNTSQSLKIQVNKHGQGEVQMKKASNGYAGSFAHAVKKGINLHHEELESKLALVLDDSCLNQNDMSTTLMGKVKVFDSLSNLKPVLANKGFDDIKLKYMGGLWATHNIFIDERVIRLDIEGVPIKVWTINTFTKIASKWGELLHDEDQEELCFYSKRVCILTKLADDVYESFKIIVQGKVFWVRAKEVCGWSPDFMEEEENESEYDEVIRKQMESQIPNKEGCNREEECTHSDDPFNIYGLLNKKKDSNNDGSSSDSNLKFPPGFTPPFVAEDKRNNRNGSRDENENGPVYVQE
nr:nucleotide-binding alpha-beta plait domain-containing protein [Tanacetum cinerariifolium]GEZ08378.1 nucleotide-binding alpha-beta plait domain-containing protein [Tanacetum cinerariifolium]GEZ08672.1 nucleotide-binding alpha-beta plait domain-containing protein [Tanacetum cinerariifolium]